MPDYSRWPNSDDIQAALSALKVWPTVEAEQDFITEQAAIAVNGVAQRVENITGWKPFLASRSTEYYTATDGNGLLWLDSGLLSVYSISVNGATALVANTGYWLTGRVRPYTTIQLTSSHYAGQVWTTPNRISIDAVWGYSDTVPADLWGAVKDMATLSTLVSMQGEADLSSLSQPGFSVGVDLVGPVDDKTRLRHIPEEFERIVKAYVRVVV